MLATIYWIDGIERGRLGLVARPRGGDWLEDEIAAWQAAGIEVVVSLLERHEARELALTEEETFCRSAGLQYLSFPLADRSVPKSRAAMLALAQELAVWLNAGQCVVMHCRQSLGRAPLLAACVMLLSGFALTDVLSRISLARGCAIPETLEQTAWLASFSNHLKGDGL